MNKLMFAFAASMALVSFAGCKKKDGGGGGQAETLAKMTEFQKQICECKDTACATKVSEAMAAWSAEQAKKAKPGEAAKMNEKDAAAFAEVSKKMGECQTKLATAAATDAAGSAAAAGSGDAAGSGSAAAGSGDAAGSAAAGSAAGSAAAGSAAGSGEAKAEGSAAAGSGEAKK